MRTGTEQSRATARKDLLLIRGEARWSPLESLIRADSAHAVLRAATGSRVETNEPGVSGNAGNCERRETPQTGNGTLAPTA